MFPLKQQCLAFSNIASLLQTLVGSEASLWNFKTQRFENHYFHPSHSFHAWENSPQVTCSKSHCRLCACSNWSHCLQRELLKVGPSLSVSQKAASRDKQDHCLIFLFKSQTDTLSCCPSMPKTSLFHFLHSLPCSAPTQFSSHRSFQWVKQKDWATCSTPSSAACQLSDEWRVELMQRSAWCGWSSVWLPVIGIHREFLIVTW